MTTEPRKNQRQFTYITTKDHYPLELTGTMKKKVNTGYPETKCGLALKEQDKNKLIDRICSNYTDIKSVIPYDYTSKPKQNKENQIANQKNYKTGVAYLSQKSQDQKYSIFGKKKTRSISSFEKTKDNYETKKEGKKVFAENQKPKVIEPCLRPHSATLQRKIANDLHTDHFRKKEESNPHLTSLSNRSHYNSSNIKNYEGQYLGYQKQKKKVWCEAKKREYFGEGAYRNQQNSLNKMRQSGKKKTPGTYGTFSSNNFY